MLPGNYKYVEMQQGAVATGDGNEIAPRTAEWGDFNILVCQISGLDGDTITFEATIDELFWYPIMAINQSTLRTATTATVDGLYRMPVSGYTKVQARVSDYANGYIRVIGLLSATGDMGITGGTIVQPTADDTYSLDFSQERNSFYLGFF